MNDRKKKQIAASALLALLAWLGGVIPKRSNSGGQEPTPA